MRARLHIQGRSIIIEDLKKCNAFNKFIGLMFKRREKAAPLLFDFAKESRHAIHSFFVFFPFLAIWLDKNNKIAEYKVVYPFVPLVTPAKEFSKLIEIPLNEKYKKIFLIMQNSRRE